MTKKIASLPLWRVDNLYTIVMMAFGLAFTVLTFYYGLSVKIDLLTQKVEFLGQQVEEYNSKNKDIQTRLGTDESNIQIIFTKLGMLK